MDELTPLSDATLTRLPSSVRRPAYDRSTLSPGIVHIGLGNFHRAHQAWYLHRLMQAGRCHDWAIIGASVRQADADQRDRLLAQDCLTTLLELSPEDVSAEVIGPMIDYLPIEDDNAALIAQMADPRIRIVALTVTEGGYYINSATTQFDAAHPDIQHDAAHPDRPRTAFGAMIAALRRRRDAGTGAFTGQSCDNLQGNGQILRQTVVALARMSDPSLADWIDAQCSFPNAMVDCIVPATGPKERALARSLGLDDKAPVTHENFRQWVIEDDFCAGRPAWEDAGALFTDRVHDYETMKLRILNAGHQILANAGEILSLHSISDCMTDPVVGPFFERVQYREIVPHVRPVPGMAPEDYVALTVRRFANVAIVDTTRRVAFDGSSRHTGFVLPTFRDALSAGAPIDGLALVEALWARMCAGHREDGTVIEPNDPHWERLQDAALAAKTDATAWLSQGWIYGDLGEDEVFAASFGKALSTVWSDGSRAAIAAYLAEAAGSLDARRAT